MEKEVKVYDLSRRLTNLADYLYDEALTQDRFIKPSARGYRRDKSMLAPELREEIEDALFGIAENSAPELLGLPTVKPFLDKKPEIVNMAVRLKGLGNRICDLVAGRTTHPVSLQVGGVAKAPDKKALANLRDELKRSVGDLKMTAELFKTFNIPDFIRQTEFVSLKGVDEYPFIGGDLISTDGVVKREDEYLEMTNEYLDANNTSKWCKLSRESMAVGALARFNNNYPLLHPEAKKVAEYLGLAPVSHNPFMNNVAQLIETVHVVFESIRYIEALLEDDFKNIMMPVVPKAGRGVGAVEVPRGILYHDYLYDKNGFILSANCIIPTTQNNANIHFDMKELAKQFAPKGITDKQLELLCSMLVRSYDPCISCSVH